MRSGLILLAPCLGRLGSGWLLLPTGVVRLDADSPIKYRYTPYVQLPFKHKTLFVLMRAVCFVDP